MKSDELHYLKKCYECAVLNEYCRFAWEKCGYSSNLSRKKASDYVEKWMANGWIEIGGNDEMRRFTDKGKRKCYSLMYRALAS